MDLSSNQIDDEGGKELGRMLRTNTSLKTLTLRDNALRQATGHAFVEALSDNRSLQSVSLGYNSISLKYIQEIRRLLKKNGLRHDGAKGNGYKQELRSLRASVRDSEETGAMIRKAKNTKRDIQERVNNLREQRSERMKQEEDKTLGLNRDLDALEQRTLELTEELETIDKD